MKKLLFLLLFIPLEFACSSTNDNSLDLEAEKVASIIILYNSGSEDLADSILNEFDDDDWSDENINKTKIKIKSSFEKFFKEDDEALEILNKYASGGIDNDSPNWFRNYRESRELEKFVSILENKLSDKIPVTEFLTLKRSPNLFLKKWIRHLEKNEKDRDKILQGIEDWINRS